MARGKVVRYFKDPPNRELARKAALTKALADLDDRGLPYAPFLNDRFRLGKERRKLFWQAYLNRKVDAAATRSRVHPASIEPAPTGLSAQG
jgi:hypothetical protein